MVVVDAEVANIGADPSPATTVEAAAPGWSTAATGIRALKPTDRISAAPMRLPIPENAGGADHTITVTVDPAGTVTETSSDDNTRTVVVSIPGESGPDLTVRSAAAPRFEGGILILSMLVANGGEAAAGESSVAATAPGWSGATAQAPALEGGREAPVELRLPVPADAEGIQVFTVTVDSQGEIDEISEENNTTQIEAEVVVDPTTGPDLTVASQGTPAVADNRVTLGVLVRNAGDARSEETSVEADAPGWDSAQTDVGALAPGGEQGVELVLTIPEDAAAAEQEFLVTVDPDDGIEEGSEGNNTTQVTATIPPGAEEDGGTPLWPFVLAGAGLLAAAIVAAVWAFRQARRTGRPQSAGQAVELAPSPPARTVNTGFAPAETPGNPLLPHQTLECGRRYGFWLDVGEEVAESIELVPTGLPQQLPDTTTLKVAVFSLEGGFELDPDLQVADLRVGPEGSDARLFFPVRAPDEPGTAQLRCSIYHGQTLVQSRLIRALVTTGAEEADGALESVVDYSIAPSLDPAHLAALPRHRLSVMLNANADGTHGFSFVGEEEFASEASFGELELQDHVRRTRGALRQAAWGDEESWEKQKRYLYEDVDLERLRRDLITLAVRGFRVFAAITSKLSAGDDARLNELMRRPGFIQIASKQSPRHLLPTALIYDYMGFDTTARDEDYTLCPAYVASTGTDAPLEQTVCFEGDCPSRGEATVVCPSGFWGFRHALGVPVSVEDGNDAAPGIVSTADRALTVAVSTDPAFTLRTEHELELRGLFRDYGWNYASTRDDTMRLLKANRSQIVYFYCHGGVDRGGTPYIQVGPVNERGITADFLFTQGVRWADPRPLVFINGCQTTALEPEKALEFVGPLVQQAGAAGVIGTEITVFEPLARVFAKECLGRFLAGEPIGEAVRCARLALLKDGNPLGLVYIPFVLAGLVLKPA